MTTRFDELREIAQNVYSNIELGDATAQETVDWLMTSEDAQLSWGIEPDDYDEDDHRLLVRYLAELMSEA